MKKSYYQIKIMTSEDAYESIIVFFMNYKNSGFFEDDNYIAGYINKEDWDVDFEFKIREFLNSLKDDGVIDEYEIEIELLEDQNWNEQWEESVEPIIISSKIVIKPTWKEFKAEPDQIIIQIDPKMAFGTGHHETTRLCVQALEKYIRDESSLLDMGTGTGVIAIAAILLGAKEAVGIDNDEWAYDNAIENLKLNKVDDKIQIILGSKNSIPNTQFDIITSNIDFRTNSELLKSYPKYLKKDGIIILSGLLVTDLDDMKNIASECNMVVVEQSSENEWGCLVVRVEGQG
jgi:ribosomal protein L11 methyltransferase